MIDCFLLLLVTLAQSFFHFVLVVFITCSGASCSRDRVCIMREWTFMNILYFRYRDRDIYCMYIVVIYMGNYTVRTEFVLTVLPNGGTHDMFPALFRLASSFSDLLTYFTCSQ